MTLLSRGSSDLFRNMFDVDKKAAIITGSARGLGKDFAIRLLRSGAKVCLSDVNQEDGGKTLAELQDKFGPNRVHFVPCNVSVDQDWVKLWDEAEQKLGPISLLINNAGIRASSPWKANLDVNLYGVGLGVEMGIKRMGKLNVRRARLVSLIKCIEIFTLIREAKGAGSLTWALCLASTRLAWTLPLGWATPWPSGAWWA